MLEFVVAVRNAENGSTRWVFRCGEEYHVVLKAFGPSAPSGLTTVKIWNIKTSSLAKTMSYWNTQERFTPSEEGVDFAYLEIRRILSEALNGAM